MALNKFNFPGSQGHELSARLDMPSGPVKAYALFAHCFTCGKDIFAASRIAKSLNEHGIAVMRFDFTGLGMSEGEFANTNFTSNVQDLIEAANHMREDLEAPSIIIGHSLGGAAVLKAAGEIDEIKAVVTIGAPCNVSHVGHHFEDQISEINEKGEAEVKLAGRPFKIQKQFVEDIQSQNMKDVISNLKKPLLVMHAPLDNTVGIENAGEIFVTAKHPKSFISLDNADHLISREEDARYAATVIAAWAERYVGNDKRRENKATDENVQSDTQVIVKTSGKGKFQNKVIAGKHSMLADEPASVGGDDAGPDPYSFLQIALGTCTSMTLQMYANHKRLPLEGVEVYVTHDKIHAKDCEDCETREGKIDTFEREIVIKGDKLTDEQRQRFIEMADKCPVHRTLESEVKITTKEKS